MVFSLLFSKKKIVYSLTLILFPAHIITTWGKFLKLSFNFFFYKMGK